MCCIYLSHWMSWNSNFCQFLRFFGHCDTRLFPYVPTDWSRRYPGELQRELKNCRLLINLFTTIWENSISLLNVVTLGKKTKKTKNNQMRKFMMCFYTSGLRCGMVKVEVSGFAFQDAFRHSGIYLVLRFQFGKPRVICHKLNLKGVVLATKNDVPRDLQYSKANVPCICNEEQQ